MTVTMSNISVRAIQYPKQTYIYINSLCLDAHVCKCIKRYIYPLKHRLIDLYTAIFLLNDSFCCSLLQLHNMLRHASCNLCTAMLCDPTAVKHHGLLSVCLEISTCPSSLISYAAGLLLSSDTFVQCDRLHMLTVCLCYLQCRCTQTARAELKHINHSRCLQLNYKDTQFLFCRWCCVSTEPPLICLTTRRPHRCWVLLLLQGNEETTALFTFN